MDQDSEACTLICCWDLQNVPIYLSDYWHISMALFPKTSVNFVSINCAK